MEEQEIVQAAEPVVKPKRKYKDVVCRKCGTVYTSLYKECPECGFSLTRQILKITIAVLLVLSFIGSSVFLIIRVNKLETRVAALESAAANTQVSGIDLSELEYYQKNLIYDGANLAAFGDDYLIYALQDGCSACAEASETIYNYLYYGYPDYLPMYFITPESANEIFFETLNCENTPTIYRMKSGKVSEKAEGVEDVFNLLDKVVQEANAAQPEGD